MFDNRSDVLRATSVSVEVGNVNVPPFEMLDIIGVINVLFVRVCVVLSPINVVFALGTVRVLVIPLVIPDNSNCIFFELSWSS